MKKKDTLSLVLAGAAVSLTIAGYFLTRMKNKNLETVNSVDLEKYTGKWYEIARFPQRFEKGCHASTAEYSLTEKGYVKVVNKCHKYGSDGPIDSVEGKAYPVKGSNNSKLKVEFFRPFKGDYWIIDLGKNYEYSVVGAPNRKYLWILSRKPEMDKKLFDSIIEKVKAKGFDPDKLLLTDQSANTVYKSSKGAL